jgi:hypothetical protein
MVHSLTEVEASLKIQLITKVRISRSMIGANLPSCFAALLLLSHLRFKKKGTYGENTRTRRTPKKKKMYINIRTRNSPPAYLPAGWSWVR